MPFYCYQTKHGRVHEIMMSIAEMERRQAAAMHRTGQPMSIVLDDGTVATRDLQAEHFGTPDTPGTWPKLCDASGVNPSQIPEAVEAAKKHGVSIDFHPDGRAKYTSRKNRRDYLRSIGMCDFDAGYGDPEPRGTLNESEGDDLCGDY